MRSRSLAALALLLPLSGAGCLILAPDHYLFNRPLRVVEARVEPEEARGEPVDDVQVRVRAAHACQPLEFSVGVEDPDLDDVLRSRWFVDGQVVTSADDTRSASPTPLRARPFSWTVLPLGRGSPLASPGPHLVEVVVSDAPLVDRTPDPRWVGADGEVEPGYSDTRAWVVEVEAAAPCP